MRDDNVLNDPRLKRLRPWPSWAPGPEGLSDEDRAELYERLWAEHDEVLRRQEARARRERIIINGFGFVLLVAALIVAVYAWISHRHPDQLNKRNHDQQESNNHDRPSEQRPAPMLVDHVPVCNDLGDGWHPHPESESEEEPAERQLDDATPEGGILNAERARDEGGAGDVGEGDPPVLDGRWCRELRVHAADPIGAGQADRKRGAGSRAE